MERFDAPGAWFGWLAKQVFFEPSLSFQLRNTDRNEENDMDRSIRILVANRPKLMRELILATLADEPGMVVVGEVSDEAEIHDRVHETSPDLLVIALDEPAKRPDICDTLLRNYPRLRIIAVASQQNCSVFYWASFDIHSSEIEPSEQGILNAVRNITPAGAGERV
jgi:chemotaxis response regulator CheB